MSKYVLKAGTEYYSGGSYTDYDGKRHPFVGNFHKAKRFLFQSTAARTARVVNGYAQPDIHFEVEECSE